MSRAAESLTRRRLLIVMGKGGTGKSSIAAALGVLAARHGLATVVVELGAEPVLPGLLASDPGFALPAAQREPVDVAPHLSLLRIEPLVALEEYLELRFPVRALSRALLHNAGFQRFLAAAPGWRELITLGKIWHLEEQMAEGRPRYDLVVVDAPATGHGLSFLSVPGVVLDSVRLGPLRRHTDSVWQLLSDAERTSFLPVSLPEELPTLETLELCQRLAGLGLASGTPFMNCVEPLPRVPDADALADLVATIPGQGCPTRLAEPGALSAILRQQATRARSQRGFIDRLTEATGARPLELPYLAEGIEGPGGIARLADALEDVLGRGDAAA